MDLEKFITATIKEDSPTGDITAQSLNISKGAVKATLIAKQEGIFFGKDIINSCTKIFNTISTKDTLQNGVKIKKNDLITTLEGDYNDILLLERTLLNFLQHLSGIATSTNKAVLKLNNPNIKICDTRKTIPGFRKLAKQAVKAGGGFNHREGLSDMILIKENHLTALKQKNTLSELRNYILTAKEKNPGLKAEIEIETLKQLDELDLTHFDYILLDNFQINEIEKAVEKAKENQFKGEFECSGNITHDTVHTYTSLPIDRISMGCLTHSVTAFDISLLLE